MKKIIVLIILMGLCFGLCGGDLDDSAIVDNATIQPEFWTDLYNALNGDSTYDNLIPTFRKVTVDTLTNGNDVIDSTAIGDLADIVSIEEVIIAIQVDELAVDYVYNYGGMSCQLSDLGDSTFTAEFNANGTNMYVVSLFLMEDNSYYVYCTEDAQANPIFTLYDTSWTKVNYSDISGKLIAHLIWK